MQAFAGRIRWFLASEGGPTAVEYAVMLAMILLACVVAVSTVGNTVKSAFANAQSTAFGTTKGG